MTDLETESKKTLILYQQPEIRAQPALARRCLKWWGNSLLLGHSNKPKQFLLLFNSILTIIVVNGDRAALTTKQFPRGMEPTTRRKLKKGNDYAIRKITLK